MAQQAYSPSTFKAGAADTQDTHTILFCEFSVGGEAAQATGFTAQAEPLAQDPAAVAAPYLLGSGFILVGVDSSMLGMGSKAWVTRVASPVVIITRSPG